MGPLGLAKGFTLHIVGITFRGRKQAASYADKSDIEFVQHIFIPYLGTLERANDSRHIVSDGQRVRLHCGAGQDGGGDQRSVHDRTWR
jgi:hypothetical protein